MKTWEMEDIIGINRKLSETDFGGLGPLNTDLESIAITISAKS